MAYQHIIEALPFGPPYLFVDALTHLDREGAEGHYTFPVDLACYKGHFKNRPVTPGALLTECCAQIGVVCLGLYLLELEGKTIHPNWQIGLSSAEMEFLKPVFPGETVRVNSEKRYFRFQKLKCLVRMYDGDGQLVCKGIIAGMLKDTPNA